MFKTITLLVLVAAIGLSCSKTNSSHVPQDKSNLGNSNSDIEASNVEYLCSFNESLISLNPCFDESTESRKLLIFLKNRFKLFRPWPSIGLKTKYFMNRFNLSNSDVVCLEKHFCHKEDK